MPAQMDFPSPEDYEKFGKLVKKWATDPNPPTEMTPQQLQDELDRQGVRFRIPREITTVKFVRWDDNPPTLTILLPPATAIRAADANIQGQQGNYPLPPFYKPAFASNVDFEKFNTQRIGEYCINQCQ